MIKTLEWISRIFRWAKPLVLIAGLAFLGMFVATILGVSGLDSDVYLIPGLVGVCWSALFFVLVSTFPYVPPRPPAGSKFLFRLKVRIKRGCYHVLGVLFVVLTVAVLMLSVKLFGIWRADF